MTHIPVLTKEVLEYLNPKENENFVDCTVGQGGHAKLILEKTGPEGKVLGIDADSGQIENCRELLKNFEKRLILENDSYANLPEIIKKENFGQINGILLDLGMSSWQLEKSEKGFSFLKDEPLDMRYDNKNPNLTAEQIINEWPENKIEEILKEYGEESFARQIAKKISEERQKKRIKNTFQLVEAVKKATPQKFQSRWQSHRGSTTSSGHGRIHYATKTFQALRIAVNDELNNLIKVLPEAILALSQGGRIVIISFHSLEDRIAKNFLKNKEKEKILKILTKKPITASLEEIKINPRARSAKIRAAIKL
jgi:16S rRNA (cytosine1402-N4)-methyltransferase